MLFSRICKLFGAYSENSLGFLDYIPKIRSKFWISTINKDFCGLSVAFCKCVSIIILQKVTAMVDKVAADLCYRASKVR